MAKFTQPIRWILSLLVIGTITGCTTTGAASTPDSNVVPRTWEPLPPSEYQAFVEADSTESCIVLRSSRADGEGRSCVNTGEPLPTIAYWSPLEQDGGEFLIGASPSEAATLVLRVGGDTIRIPFTIQDHIASIGVRLSREPDQYDVLDASGNVIFPK